MTKEPISTEQQIKEAAERIFLQKGYDGATTRDIAEEAGINRALVNYYFRSKENLFQEILMEKAHIFFQENIFILKKPISIIEKIREIIDYDFEKYIKAPELSLFIHNEIHRNNDFFITIFPLDSLKTYHDLFNKQILEAIERGEIRAVNPNHLLALLSASVKHHFASKPLIMRFYKLEEDDFNKFLIEQKQLTFDMIANYLTS